MRFVESRTARAALGAMHVEALNGDCRDVGSSLRIRNRRAALHGLESPQRIRLALITEADIELAVAGIERETEAMKAADSAGGPLIWPSTRSLRRTIGSWRTGSQ